MVFGKHFLLPSPILSGDILQKCSLFFTSVQFRTRVLVIFLSPDVTLYEFSQNLVHLKLVELVWQNICLISYTAKVTWGWWTGSRIFQRLCSSHPWGNNLFSDDLKMKMIKVNENRKNGKRAESLPRKEKIVNIGTSTLVINRQISTKKT